MAVTKRLRYEILRRDNHTCQICGRTAPGVALTVDHVVPVALGGSDDPANLQAACRDCNAGKSSVPADAPMVEAVAAEAARWSAAMKQAYVLAKEKREGRMLLHEAFQESWLDHRTRGGMDYPMPTTWRVSIDKLFDAGLGWSDLYQAIQITMSKTHVARGDMFTYFCGVGWSMLDDRQSMARQILAAEED